MTQGSLESQDDVYNIYLFLEYNKKYTHLLPSPIFGQNS